MRKPTIREPRCEIRPVDESEQEQGEREAPLVGEGRYFQSHTARLIEWKEAFGDQ